MGSPYPMTDYRGQTLPCDVVAQDNWVIVGLDGHHVQFNIVDTETLKKAQADPDSYRDLLVRVAGYSDYFVDLGRDLQNEIIARTEQNAL